MVGPILRVVFVGRHLLGAKRGQVGRWSGEPAREIAWVEEHAVALLEA
ncbi:hypothetical protein [Microlunatus speluncae]|nr:hypothetical protein [Microlunatus speluncae]